MNSCEICYRSGLPLKSDHCHYHDIQRGKICHRCNLLMGRVDKGMPVLVPWVPLERIVSYRNRCAVCSTEDIRETIRKHHEKCEADLANYMLAVKPIADIPGPAERIRLRNLSGVSQEQLADALHVSRRTVHSWERGKSEPTGSKRERYADMLNLWQELEREQ